MANAFVTPDVIAKRALVALFDQLDVTPLFHTDLTQEFTTQKIGNTINVKKPATFEAKLFNRANGIELQDAEEETVPVVLDKIADVSFAVTSEQMTLEISAFDEQLITPAVQALALHVNTAALALRNEITQEVGTEAGFEWDGPEVLAAAGRLLDLQNAPQLDRAAIIGPTMYSKWLTNELIKQADKSGSTDALRRGSVGRDLFGFDTFKSTLVGQPKPTGSQVAGDPTTEVGMAFHKSAFAYASAPLEVPPGSNASVVSYRGISIRVAYDYDIKYKQTVVSLDTLYGVKTLRPELAVLLKGADKA